MCDITCQGFYLPHISRIHTNKKLKIENVYFSMQKNLTNKISGKATIANKTFPTGSNLVNIFFLNKKIAAFLKA